MTAEDPPMPDAETVRGWWHDLLTGSRSRDEVYALASVWLEGELMVDDALAESALFDLHGANLRAEEPDAGEWLHPMDDMARRYEEFAAEVRFRNEDPEGWQAAVEERRRRIRAARPSGQERTPLSGPEGSALA